MVNFEIVKIEKWNYILKDIKLNKIYTKGLEFHDLPQPVKVGDKIAMHKQLLDSTYAGYSNLYAFGNLKNPAGRDVYSTDDMDVIAVKQDDKITYLKRLYG